MLEILVPASEIFNQDTNQFIYTKDTKLHLEHSLISISKWESKWNKPFLVENNKTTEQFIDYIKCMTIDKNVDEYIYEVLTNGNIVDISNYIASPMTATSFSEVNSKTNKEVITSEIIYYWMISLNIPMECQRWHINRLLTLIRVCDVKNSPQKKMTKKEILERNRALNEARRKKLNTKG